jgi:hypothetical protein
MNPSLEWAIGRMARILSFVNSNEKDKKDEQDVKVKRPW